MNVHQLALEMAIAFFGVQVAAWAGLCLYLRLTHERRAAVQIADIAKDAAVAQAA